MLASPYHRDLPGTANIHHGDQVTENVVNPASLSCTKSRCGKKFKSLAVYYVDQFLVVSTYLNLARPYEYKYHGLLLCVMILDQALSESAELLPYSNGLGYI